MIGGQSHMDLFRYVCMTVHAFHAQIGAAMHVLATSFAQYTDSCAYGDIRVVCTGSAHCAALGRGSTFTRGRIHVV